MVSLLVWSGVATATGIHQADKRYGGCGARAGEIPATHEKEMVRVLTLFADPPIKHKRYNLLCRIPFGERSGFMMM